MESGILLSIGILNPISTDNRDWNQVPGILNPRRGIQNPRLSWISLHGAEHKCFDLGSKVVGLTAHVPPATTEVTTIGYTIGRKELKTAKTAQISLLFQLSTLSWRRLLWVNSYAKELEKCKQCITSARRRQLLKNNIKTVERKEILVALLIKN